MILIDIICIVVGFIADAIKDLKKQFDFGSSFVAVTYFISFFGLIISVIKLGVNGDLIWGFVALVFAVILMFIGLITGTL